MRPASSSSCFMLPTLFANQNMCRNSLVSSNCWGPSPTFHKCEKSTLPFLKPAHVYSDYIPFNQHMDVSLNGGTQQPWFFPTKNDHFGVFWGYHHLRKHPYPLPASTFESWIYRLSRVGTDQGFEACLPFWILSGLKLARKKSHPRERFWPFGGKEVATTTTTTTTTTTITTTATATTTTRLLLPLQPPFLHYHAHTGSRLRCSSPIFQSISQRCHGCRC